MTLQTGLPRSGDTGTVIGGRYRLDGVLGRGGMSVVHAATDLFLGRRVAVKLLAPGVDERDRRRLEDELSLLAGFDHPGLVTVFDAVPGQGPDDSPAVVMQLVPGNDLAERLRSGPLPPSTAAAVGADIAAALAYLASRSVVHRDVKPANILLSPDGRARLTDFGIARIVGSRGLTATGTIIGTMRYLSPEQVRGGEVSAASDVYSLGLVLVEALTGRPAFAGTDPETAAARLASAPAIPGALGAAWAEVLSAMTAIDPAGRCEASWAAERLSELAEAPGIVAPPSETVPLEADPATVRMPAPPAATTKAAASPGRGMVAALSALGIVLAAAVGGGALWLAAQPPAYGPRSHAELVVPAVEPPAGPEGVEDDGGGPGNSDQGGGNNGNGNPGNGNGNNGNGNGNGKGGD